jgi:hypothetical protein
MQANAAFAFTRKKRCTSTERRNARRGIPPSTSAETASGNRGGHGIFSTHASNQQPDGEDQESELGRIELGELTKTQRQALVQNAPLWFYVLREAEFNGGRLKGVGARVVAEVFHRAIEGSQFSIVNDPSFQPTLGPNNKTFRMVDLLFFAFEGKKSLLAPLG